MEVIIKRLKRDKRGVSNVIVVMLSLILIVVIVANVVLWSYQMNQIDWEKMQENIAILDVSTNQVSLSYNPSGYALGGSTSWLSGDISDLTSDDGVYMSFRSYYSGTGSSDFVEETGDFHLPSAKGTHSNFTAQQYGPDLIYDTLTEADTSTSDNNNVDSEIITGGSTTGISGAQTVDGIMENMTEGAPAYVDSTEASVGSGTSITIPAPSDIQDDDFMIMSVVISNPATLTPPSGWTQQFDFDYPSTFSTPHHTIWTKVASSESGDYTVTSSASLTLVGHIAVYRGADATPHKLGGPNIGIDANPTSPSVTTEVDGCVIVYMAGTDDDEVPFPESGFYPPGVNGREATERTGSGNGASLGLADKVMVSVGASGTAVWNPVGSEEWGAVTIALAPSVPNQQIDIEHVVNAIGNYQNYNLTTRAYCTASENFYLQLYNFTSSQWTNISTITGLSLMWYNTSFVKADFVNSTDQARIRYWQGVDATRENLCVDYSGVYGWNATNYELDLEVQWTNADYDETNEELCIYGREGNNTHSLDATGGYMIIGDGTPDWGSAAGTISFWVKMDTSVQGRFYGQDGNMETRWSGTNLILDWGATGSMTSAYSFSADTWYFVAIVWDENDDNLFLYVGDENNAPILDPNSLTGTWISTTPTPTQNRFLNGLGVDQPVDGHGDDLRYWNVARSLTEIQSDYNTELTGSEPNLRSYFKLNNNFDDIGPDDNDGSGSGSYLFSPDVAFDALLTEDIRVDVWYGSAWQNVFTNLNSGWNNVSVSPYLDSSTFSIRFKDDADASDTVQDGWDIDVTLLHVWSDEYALEVEFMGSSNTDDWSQLNWTVNSAWTAGSVNVALQLYNYTLGGYSTSEEGYAAYTSDSTPNTDENKSQMISVAPTHFRNATGHWKMKITGVKATDTQFDFKADWIEFKAAKIGVLFTFENGGPMTSHLVSLWINNSTHHQRYDINIFINSGDTESYIRNDISLPNKPYTVKIVTKRGNTAVFTSH